MRLGLTAALTAVALFAATGCSQPSPTPESTTQQAVPTAAATTAVPAPASTLTSQSIPPAQINPTTASLPQAMVTPQPTATTVPPPTPLPCLRRHPCPPPHPFTSRFQPSFPRLLLREYLWKQAQDPHQPNPAALLSPRNFHSPSNQLNLIPGVMPFSPCKGLTRGKG